MLLSKEDEVGLVLERYAQGSLSQLSIKILNEDLPVLREKLLGLLVKDNLKEMFSLQIDPDSFSDNLGGDDKVLKNLVIDAGEGPRVGDLLVVAALLGYNCSLSNDKEIYLKIFRYLIGKVSNGSLELLLQGIGENEDSAAGLLVGVFLESVFVGILDLYFGVQIIVLLRLSHQFCEVLLHLLFNAGFDGHYVRFIKI